MALPFFMQFYYMLNRAIRATFDNDTITVYQAYNKAIANSAVEAQTFVSPPFKLERMTWIKPSFLWMMYRSGWASKENQEHVLAIRIKRSGFHWAIEHACLSHFDREIHGSHDEWKEQLKSSPVRIQWDPEKDIGMQELPYRSIQIGLTGNAVEHYVNDWIVSIEDITGRCHEIYDLFKSEAREQAQALLPQETLYELPEGIGEQIRYNN